MDRFTRNYSIFLGLLVLLLLAWWLSGLDLRARELNAMLDGDAVLAAYPYRFRVTGVTDGVATVTSPRSPQVSVLRFLAVIEPALQGKDGNDPALLAAQKDLAAHQGRARALLLAEADIQRVRWVIDRQWYAQRGIQL